MSCVTDTVLDMTPVTVTGHSLLAALVRDDSEISGREADITLKDDIYG